ESSDLFINFPEGEHEFEFKRFGFKSEVQKFEIESGEVTTLEVSLEPTPLMALLINLSKSAMLLGVLAFPVGVYLVYKRYLTKGRDSGMPGTIVPEYTIPENISPYL